MKSQLLLNVAVSVAAAVVVAFVVPQAGAAQSDPMVGTWKLNVAKSKYNPGPGPRSLTAVVTPSGQGTVANTEGVNAQGMPTKTTLIIICDGQPHPVTGAPNVDAISCRQPDPYTQNFTNMKGGRATTSGTLVVSRDGKTTTISTKGTTAAGQQVDNVAVYDRQ